MKSEAQKAAIILHTICQISQIINLPPQQRSREFARVTTPETALLVIEYMLGETARQVSVIKAFEDETSKLKNELFQASHNNSVGRRIALLEQASNIVANYGTRMEEAINSLLREEKNRRGKAQ